MGCGASKQAEVANAKDVEAVLAGIYTRKKARGGLVGVTNEPKKLSLSELRELAVARGFSYEFADSLSDKRFVAYFIITEKLQQLAQESPEALLLPWERMNYRGVTAAVFCGGEPNYYLIKFCI